MSRRPGPGMEADDLGFGGARGSVRRLLGRFVPAPLARRAIAVSVRTDRDVYDRGDPVEITVAFENRLPVAVVVPTPEHRRWGWAVDGELEASDERRYTRPAPSSFAFRGGERKRLSFTWNGRFERTETGEWILPEPGEHEIEAFVAVHAGRHRPADATTITVR